MTDSIIVVGSGVIGASTALALLRDGHKVQLIDKEAPCAGASFGNAGAIVNGSCAPTAMPGIIFDALNMLIKAHSPLSIRPAYFHKILPWLVRFMLQSRKSSVSKNAEHLYALSKSAADSWRQLTDKSALSDYLHNTGWLKLYESDAALSQSKTTRDLLDNLDSPYEIIDANQISDLEPNLAPIFKWGFFQKDTLSISNPDGLVKSMVGLFVNEGGRYQQFDAQTIEVNSSDRVSINGASDSLKAAKVVIAAGAWSKTLAAQLGDTVPLDTEAGYHLMMPQSSASLLNRPVVCAKNSFVLSPMETGLRMTSQVEFSGIHAEPDYSKIRRLLPLVKDILPSADITEQSVWRGFRPSLPDSLPVLGFSSQSNNVLYAFGHQHLGMTLAAVTSFIITDLIAGRSLKIPLAPYQANRFSLL